MNTHEEIAVSLTSIFQLLISLGYITKDDVSWPSHLRSTTLVGMWKARGLSDVAIGFLQNIPWMKRQNWPCSDFEFIPYSAPVDWSDEDDVACSRHPVLPELDEDEIDTEAYLPEHMLALSVSTNNSGSSLVMDTAGANTPRNWTLGLP